ncbi:hypothetical protein J8L85_06860 [Maribacter sp. MMG018]|uniref:hypothetical protein n=1 Tax=Maribacter sp. MMG018 TaxID=2822688 RepID=UPI001B366C4D|nr:hypothetical protein [Maribacter sp. MMG018]MBQ4914149.1 hypothetical protein [Maribacter sp. MMG018]
MKNLFSYTIYFSLLMVVLSFTSCQDEFEEISTDEQETITANSATASLVKSASAKDGSFDDVVDNSSCFAIKFPYTVSINGLEIVVDSYKDLWFLKELVKQYDDDFGDMLTIVFPITITYSDFSELTINNLVEFRELANECTGDPVDARIPCVAFVYPIKLFTFDLNNQQTGSVEVESDLALRRFFKDLDDDSLVSIDFPISLKKRGGEEVVVNSNEELAIAIESAKNSCIVDDDFFDDDFYDDDDDDCENCSTDQLTEMLLACPYWYVYELKLENEGGLEEEYDNYWFSFKENGNVNVTVNDEVFEGSWAASSSLNTTALVINIPDLTNFNATWRLDEIEIGDGFKKIEFEFGDENEMVLKSDCRDEIPAVCETEVIVETLNNCTWDITNIDGTFFEELTIDFSNYNIHVYSDDDNDETENVLDEGNWEISGTTITFNSLSMTLANYVGEWEIVSCEPERYKLQRGEEIIVLTKDCD